MAWNVPIGTPHALALDRVLRRHVLRPGADADERRGGERQPLVDRCGEQRGRGGARGDLDRVVGHDEVGQRKASQVRDVPALLALGRHDDQTVTTQRDDMVGDGTGGHERQAPVDRRVQRQRRQRLAAQATFEQVGRGR